MPATVINEPLAVEFVFPDGSQWTGRLEGLPNRRLAAELANGLAHCAHPHGGVASKTTAVIYCVALRATVRRLHEAGFSGSAADLRRHHMVQLWMAMLYQDETCSRMIFKAFDDVTGELDPQVRALLPGRKFNTPTPTTPYEPYSDAEWARLIQQCEGLISEAERRQRHALRLAEAGTDPRGSDPRSGVTAEDIAWVLTKQGPMTRHQLRTYLGWLYHWVDDTGTTARLLELCGTLFPTKDLVYAFQLLFGAFSGIVPDGISDLGVNDLDWAGDGDVLVDYIKGRSGPESVHLPKRAVRLLERWLDYSALVRTFAGKEVQGELWLAFLGAKGGSGPSIRPVSRKAGYARGWARRHGLKADDGSVFPVHKARIRTTYLVVLARRGWTGRIAIDPNHTPEVEGDHYLSATTPAQMEAIEAIIEEAQGDILRKVNAPTVDTDESLADIVTALPQAITALGLDNTAIGELIGGERDVFTAACADQLASPFAPAGTPCPARPWVCLMCPLALFMPRHAPNLLRLKAFFARQFRQMPADQFLRVFGPYAHRLDTEVLPRFNEQTLADAARYVADDDGELPLRPEETTWPTT
ncbi:hypothetical protein ACWEPN_09820 [Nonomuraea wenchangensis]